MPADDPDLGGVRVTVFPHPGAWSQWIMAAARVVVAVPAKVPDEVAGVEQQPNGQWR
ncbi:hypothetical protein ACWGCW_14765 [Streptomyces sp. NPDC054933]